MQPAIRSQKMNVRVKNSYNREAKGTIISKGRDMSCSVMTSIVLKNNVTLVDIVSSRMLGQFGEYNICCRLCRTFLITSVHHLFVVKQCESCRFVLQLLGGCSCGKPHWESTC